jgi:putative DNA primase/helicase
MKERVAAAVIHLPHSAPDPALVDDEPDLHRNAPRPDPACLYGLLGRVAEAGSTTTEANPYAVAFNALIYLSAGIGRGPFLPVGNTWHHGNLFGLHVGRSGRGRKGDAAGLVHRIDRALQDRGTPEAVQVWRSGLSTREGLVSLIHDGYTEGKNEVPPINDKRLCVFESEFVNVLHQGKREGNTLSAALRDAWDGVSIKPATKSAKIGATDPHIAIVGAVTPSELRTSMAARELTNGFANRFVMIFAERTRMVPFPEATPQDVVNSLATEFGQAFEFAQAGRWVEKDTMRVSLSPAAAALYASLYRELCNEVGGPAVFPLLERRAPVLLRIALILAVTDRTAVIERHHVEAAHAEPARELWRLQPLRRWSHEQVEQVLA